MAWTLKKKHFYDVFAHFCAPFGQNMCAFEFRIIGHSDHIIKDNKIEDEDGEIQNPGDHLNEEVKK